MPKKKSKKRSKPKEPAELTDEEAMRKLFPKAVRDEIKRQAGEADDKAAGTKKGGKKGR